MKAGIRSFDHSSLARIGAGVMCTKRRSEVMGRPSLEVVTLANFICQ
jgi:hypothetical protein